MCSGAVYLKRRGVAGKCSMPETGNATRPANRGREIGAPASSIQKAERMATRGTCPHSGKTPDRQPEGEKKATTTPRPERTRVSRRGGHARTAGRPPTAKPEDGRGKVKEKTHKRECVVLLFSLFHGCCCFGEARRDAHAAREPPTTRSHRATRPAEERGRKHAPAFSVVATFGAAVPHRATRGAAPRG